MRYLLSSWFAPEKKAEVIISQLVGFCNRMNKENLQAIKPAGTLEDQFIHVYLERLG